ncbi:TlpA disulfide reductase family protein [Terriglobus saanensis]|uniref:Alkyl hydroperoxide reductase/ Thiol specific antioxidant/ Mal allergen n=1 Tax=Terriglobus saanensis (strain ATCC BAA-1853 / DSM 23119 / SP1PR4) TaxID=401053 RepID=E8V5G5_TERSS|nr:TlpA disulfide reductase family protein [Terriglobus saanensis]ADV81499.1 alkyl hydroperoxide reductase/ Thiol specific antioxidant/ Mal allergen [Terriglobus saanensis SP1PR4]
MKAHRTAFLALICLAAPFAHRFLNAQATPDADDVTKEITGEIRDLRQVPDAQRGARTTEIALKIRALPAGGDKRKLATGFASYSTESDPGAAALQAVTTTLSQAIKEAPISMRNNRPGRPYMLLAKLVRFEGMTTDLKGPEIDRAQEILAQEEAEIQKTDFTLDALKGQKVQLSDLRGKVVVVNFWATWCPPCRKEMPDLDALHARFARQGLVVLSITQEDTAKVTPFISDMGYKSTVLFDPEGKVSDSFHVDDLPRNFIFDREGKLVAQSVNMLTERQLLAKLAKAGIH